jgi:SAM-dependent methyltransferase
MIRSARYLMQSLGLLARYDPERNRIEMDAAYAKSADAWGYTTTWGESHLRCMRELLGRAGKPRFARALEIGCGEGYVTQVVAPQCDSLLAMDVSEVALAAARARCAALPQVRFRRSDLLEGEPLSGFDLVLAMGVLEMIARPGDLRRARERVIDAMAPGGHLLVTSTRQHPVIESAWWSRYLVRGAKPLDRFLVEGGRLARAGEIESPTHLLSLYRK